MRTYLLIILTILSLHGAAQSPSEIFGEANELYRNEQYNEALDAYLGLVNDGYKSAALYYNIGNAFYKTNQTGKAIQYYEKAAQLAPRDEEIRQNLNIAEQATIDRFEEMPKPIFRATWLAVITAMHPDTWAWISIAGFALLLIGAYMYFFTVSGRSGFGIGCAGLLVGVLCLVFAYAHSSYMEENRPAVVLSTSSYVKSGPGQKAEDVLILHEGTKVWVTESYEDWRKIKLIDGKVGWIRADDLGLI